MDFNNNLKEIIVSPKKIMQFRYSTKSFNSEKKIPELIWKDLAEAVRLTPSSINVQPWRLVVAQDEKGKERMLKGTQGDYSFNAGKIKSSSHTMLFCCKTSLDQDYKNHLLAQEEKDGRFKNEDIKEKTKGARDQFVGVHEKSGDLTEWMEKQVYISIGTALLAAGAIGIDAVPMEGLDAEVLDKEFSLTEKGLKAVCFVCFGYRAEDDFNASLPKSRLPDSEIFISV
jgi:nitroreductase/dihydropteridine reductase